MANSEQNQETEEKKKPGIRQWIYVSLTVICTILFVIWTGYYAVLILIPVFIDIYITKFVPWGAWKNAKNPKMRKVMDWVDAILFALVGVYFITTFFFQNYQIPTSSLEKSLLVGDFLCVNKTIYGARSPMTPLSFPLLQHTFPIIETKTYFEKPQLEYKRFAGIRSVERNDIVVFNYPSGDTIATKRQSDDYYRLCFQDGHTAVNRNTAKYGEILYRPVDRRENYVKRCIGLPGETIELRNDTTFIDNVALADTKYMQLYYCIQTDGTEISTKVFDELGISKDDQKDISSEELSLRSSTLESFGLNPDTSVGGRLHYYVNMTKEMAETMEKKPFVKKVIKQNQFFKNRYKVIPTFKYVQPQYPIRYYPEIPMGDFPSLWIPKKGATITFDENIEYKAAAYQRCIKNYEHNDFEYRDGKVFINGQQADSYTFKFDYYFMMGDNRDKSADSRMWGLVPEDHVVGQPMFIWLSMDKDKSGLGIRWNRLFTTGNKTE